MKKIYLILTMLVSSYVFAVDVEKKNIQASIGGADIVSICVFPSDTAQEGFLYLYVSSNGVHQVMANDTAKGMRKFATCERKTKKR